MKFTCEVCHSEKRPCECAKERPQVSDPHFIYKTNMYNLYNLFYEEDEGHTLVHYASFLEHHP